MDFKHEPFQEINTISTQYVIFQSVYLFGFRMKMCWFGCLYLMLFFDKLCIIQDGAGCKKTSKTTKPTKLRAQDGPRSLSKEEVSCWA